MQAKQIFSLSSIVIVIFLVGCIGQTTQMCTNPDICSDDNRCCSGYICCDGACVRAETCACTGNIILSEQFLKNYTGTNISSGTNVQFTICGLNKYCENETVYIKESNCDAPDYLTSFKPVYKSSCNNFGGSPSFFLTYGSHTICACIDINKDNKFDGGERSCRSFLICHSNLSETCYSDAMCCEGRCMNGKCCLTENQVCRNNEECCTNFCSNGTCKEIPVTTCAGQTKLDLPSIVSPQSPISAKIYGLNSLCAGHKVYLKKQNCTGEIIISTTLDSNGSRSFQFSAPSMLGTHTYAACVDITGNETFDKPEEYTTKQVRVCYGLGQRCENDNECCCNICDYVCGACDGDVNLSLSAYNVTPNATILATISGLSNRCLNRTIELRQSSCVGELIKSCNVEMSFCEGDRCTYGCQFSFNAPAQNGTYRYFAFLDLDLDGFICISEKEYGYAIVNVI
ncbi:MAG: hypothetical protein OH354_05120 [Candidatus Parvarchaeota archaeon]|nr:hypothetical protein [Candidatus Jingweiarchaeum tengchongense]MCW1305125.1 hypothetical protein [Candidatus Jingweiarchaeum tengchongense]MCW1305544.1 hypothetical protein [Candidatus Jingweiarchaeum tengchongense]